MEDTMVVKREGTIVAFAKQRIHQAIGSAVEAVGFSATPEALADIVNQVCTHIQQTVGTRNPRVEEIQDIVERTLMDCGWHAVAKAYVLYRSEREKERVARKRQATEAALNGAIHLRGADGVAFPIDAQAILQRLTKSARSIPVDILDLDLPAIRNQALSSLYDGASPDELERALIQACAGFMELDPAYDTLGARLFCELWLKRLGIDSETTYRLAFPQSIAAGIAAGLLDQAMSQFDIDYLAASLAPELDADLAYQGLETLYERYVLHRDDIVIETPQAFWMRVAMGLALGEPGDKASPQCSARVVEFYRAIAELRFVPSTPTLFHAGTRHPQLSSCYLSTVKDDLAHIFKVIGDNAQLSKYSGGIGNDWTPVRATGAMIQTIRISSQGLIPFLKISNDATHAINRSGKRRGAACAYLEVWHLDFEDFLDLKRNTGDERRRTHDLNTAAWVPDLFMKRVLEDGVWTFFSPEEVPELHEIFGREFEVRYLQYEAQARAGKVRLWREIKAETLWRKMLTRLFETGHPWITFKDPCNIRSPQDHAGVVHNSNLCTEITLNTSVEETAVCNLGSINLVRHLKYDSQSAAGVPSLDDDLLGRTVKTAVRMLDNVIDINFYPTIEAKTSNMRHRPIGLGLMGFQDLLLEQGLSYEDAAALELADSSMELISFHAIMASSELAEERGAYSSYPGSKWNRGILPQDSLAILALERGIPLVYPDGHPIDAGGKLDWSPVRAAIRAHGMRNSNVLAIAPTATISTIAGCYPSFEPLYKNLYVKANMSGEFTLLNKYLVRSLKQRGLWNRAMLELLKVNDGRIEGISTVPHELKRIFRETFDLDQGLLVAFTAVRGKWIDQSQSHNVFSRGSSGRQLSEIYMAAWKAGLKTTYYLRTLGASTVEKSTLDAKIHGFTQKRSGRDEVEPPIIESSSSCRIDDPSCESCQ